MEVAFRREIGWFTTGVDSGRVPFVRSPQLAEGGTTFGSMVSAKNSAERAPSRAASGRQRYIAYLRSRIRIGSTAAMLRTVVIQSLWIVVIVAGAGVPLSAALQGPEWIAPILGFTVVVAAGIERVFRKTTSAAVAQDTLRRGLAREQRMFMAGAHDYVGEGAFDEYLKRSEQLIAEYDQAMLTHSSSLAGQGLED